MKKIIIATFIFTAALFTFTACDDSSDTENVSRVTNYPVFEYEPLIVLPLGGTFEPAAVATEGGAEIPVTTSENVDTSTVGIYTVNYTATNVDGFAANASQTVVVHDPAIVGTDVSGNLRDKNNAARTTTISLVPGTTSIFYATDFGFAGAFPIYFQMDGDTISEIPQTYPLGQTSIALTYDPGIQEFGITITPAGFSYTFQYIP